MACKTPSSPSDVWSGSILSGVLPSRSNGVWSDNILSGVLESYLPDPVVFGLAVFCLPVMPILVRMLPVIAFLG